MSQHTVFGDLRDRATAVYRVQTQASVYLVGFHEAGGRKFVIVRGEPGTDREHVVIRDSDPRVGDRSMFEVPITQWPGQTLEVATMTSSTIVRVTSETDPATIAAVGVDGKLDRSPWARPEQGMEMPAFQAPRPPGMPQSPRIIPGRAKGTHPAADAPALPQNARGLPQNARDVAKQVVVGGVRAAQPETETPYPERHVLYAENCAALLRSLAKRDRLFEDASSQQRDRLRRSLDDAASLLEQIRRRDRK